jgi:hypothetical protein
MPSYDDVVRELKESWQSHSVANLPMLLDDVEYYADAAIHSGRFIEAKRWRMAARIADAILHGEFDGNMSQLGMEGAPK